MFKQRRRGVVGHVALIGERINMYRVLLGKPIYRVSQRNVRDFGRVFLMLNYTDITQNTYIQS